MREIKYNRDKSVSYAHKWAFDRNPKYYNFDGQGGDCTNFASQCLFAGCGVMNHGGIMGWFYNSPSSRSPSWSGVEFIYNFLTKNKGVGPYGLKADVKDVQPGDLVQLKLVGASVFGHSPVIVSVGSPSSIDTILVSTHTFNADNRRLNTYNWDDIRFIHIQGARK